MIGLTTGDQVLVAVYGALAVATWVAARRDRRIDKKDVDVWPAIWLLAGGFLIFAAIGRAVDVVATVSDATRSRAIDDGWYAGRRRVQVVVVGVVAAMWAATILFAATRNQERRGRYLCIAVAIVTLATFVTVRSISLHQVDAMLSRGVGSVDAGIMIEWLLLSAVAFGIVQPSRTRERDVTDEIAPTRRA